MPKYEQHLLKFVYYKKLGISNTFAYIGAFFKVF